MPRIKPFSGPPAVLTVAVMALAIGTSPPAFASDIPYPLIGRAVPIDLGPDPAEAMQDAAPPDDTGVLTAHVTVSNRIDDACRAAASESNGEDPGTIVVCSHGGDGTDQRVPPSRSVDESTRNGALHPPDVSGLPGCLGPCVTIHFGHVPPPVYYIDLSTIPQAPVGSDAWKIAQGLIRAP